VIAPEVANKPKTGSSSADTSVGEVPEDVELSADSAAAVDTEATPETKAGNAESSEVVAESNTATRQSAVAAAPADVVTGLAGRGRRPVGH